MNIRDRFNAQQEAFETALAASKESETRLLQSIKEWIGNIWLPISKNFNRS